MNSDDKHTNRRPDSRDSKNRPKKKKKWFFNKKQQIKPNDKNEELWNLPLKQRSSNQSQQRPVNNQSVRRPANNDKSRKPVHNEQLRNSQKSDSVRLKNGQVNTQQRPVQNNGVRPIQNNNEKNKGNINSNNINRNSSADRQRPRQTREKDPNFKKIRVYKQDELNEKVTIVSNEQRKRFYVGLVGFIIFLYFGSNIYRMIAGSGVETMQLSKISIDTPKIYDTLIVRDENVTAASKAGEVDYKIANNEKARVGDLVATIVDENIQEETHDISSEEFTQVSKVSNSDVDNINDRIKNEFSYRKISDFTEAYVYSEKIYESLEIRNQIIISSMYNAEGSTSVSTSEKESLYTAKSGIVNYNLDSYEEVYTTEKMDEIVYDDIKTVVKDDSTVRNKVVAEGENVFKVIESNVWYIVAFIDNEEIKSREIELDKVMEIYLSKSNTFKPVMSKVHSITEGEKTSKVIFQCDSFIGDFAEQRSVAIKLAKENVEGYKVPKTAIIKKDAIAINKDFVFFNEEQGYDFVVKEGYNGEQYEVPIVKYSTTENVVYVLKETSDLNMGDMLINGDKQYQIPDVYVINGVYVLNTGIAVFKEVFPSEDTLSDESLVFLESKNNTNIRIHDTIAVNIDEITENEIIY